MSEGAYRRFSIASLRLRLNDERRPGFRVAAGPARADEGGGPDAGADSTPLLQTDPPLPMRFQAGDKPA